MTIAELLTFQFRPQKRNLFTPNSSPSLHTHTVLIQLTNDPQCSLTTLADLINDRMRNSSWVVVFKALIVSHNLMTLGNEVVQQGTYYRDVGAMFRLKCH